MTDNPLVLTNKEHRICHERWLRWKQDFSDRVNLAKRIFHRAERSVLAFGPHLDGMWIDKWQLHEDVYGPYDPVDDLLEVLHFPPHSELVDRTRVINRVKELIRDHESYGAGSGYAERSVVMGWIIRQHDAILSDLKEVA